MSELDAGRELDALIAEQVMGLQVVAHDWPCGYEPDSCGLQAASWPEREAAWMSERGPVYLHEGGTWPPKPDLEDHALNWGPYANVTPVPFYSTDIAAAWTLIDWAYQQPDAVLSRVAGALKQQPTYGPGPVQALRICRAVLAAVGGRS